MSIRRLVAPAVVLACISLTALPAYARGGGKTTSTAGAVVTVSPTTVAIGGTPYYMNGCHYAADKDVQIMVDMPESMAAIAVRAGADGCWMLKFWTGNVPGTYTIRTYQQLSG